MKALELLLNKSDLLLHGSNVLEADSLVLEQAVRMAIAGALPTCSVRALGLLLEALELLYGWTVLAADSVVLSLE